MGRPGLLLQRTYELGVAGRHQEGDSNRPLQPLGPRSAGERSALDGAGGIGERRTAVGPQ